MDPNPSIIKFLLQYQQTRHSDADIAHHQPYGSHAALSSESQFLSQWQNLSLDETPNFQSRQDLMAMDEIKHHFSLADLQKHSEGQPYLSTGKGNQQPNKQVPFGMLLPILQSQFDDNRAMQLQTLYFKLMKNEISKDGFVRHIRSIVGDQMLKMAVYKLQTQAARNSRTAAPNQMQLPSKL